MKMSHRAGALNPGAALVGFLLGLAVGGVYAILHIKKSGAVRRRDLTHFGVGSVELEIEASLDNAKTLARERLQDAD